MPFSITKKDSLIFIPWAVFIVAQLFSLQFGSHWDEIKLIDAIATARENGNVFPGWYNYPSFCFDIGYLLSFFISDVHSETFLLTYRIVFVILASAVIPGIYAVLKSLAFHSADAIIWASFFVTSFEFAYHARWVAPDAAGTALAVWAVFFALQPKRIIWAGIFIGLAFSIKYNYLFIALPVAWITLYYRPHIGQKMRALAFLFLAAAAISLCITPALVFKPVDVFHDIRFEMEHYQQGHNGYSVNGWTEGIPLSFEYAFLRFFPAVFGVAYVLLFFAGLGILRMIRKKLWGVVFPLLGFIVIYTVWVGRYHVWFPRNMLIITPFVLVLSATGWQYVSGFFKTQWNYPRIALLVLCTGGILLNAADSLWHRRPAKSPDFEAYRGWEEKFPEKDNIQHSQLLDMGMGILHDTLENPEYYAFIWAEASVSKIKAGKYSRIYRDFGPRDINLNYYPTWPMAQRIVVVRKENMETLEDIAF